VVVFLRVKKWLQQPFVNVFGAAFSCAETARSLFPLELAVKGGLP
jgi:hypothetical protein